MLVGLGLAFKTFAGIYYDLSSDPLAEQATAAEPEKEASKAMLTWAAVGIAGAPIAAIGAFLTMKARIDRTRARQGRR
jgi:hypothetical protein